MKILTILFSGLITSSAFAAGGTSCSVENDSIVINVALINTHGIPGAPIAQGTVEVYVKEHLSTSWSYRAVEDNIGWWNSADEIKFSYYSETSNENSFLSVEVQKSGDEETAFGVYKFYQNGTMASSGLISCSYE
ncbi:hypothetical protein GW916_06270 [bacterium]|nr:hypothetical protein [bacterium]